MLPEEEDLLDDDDLVEDDDLADDDDLLETLESDVEPDDFPAEDVVPEVVPVDFVPAAVPDVVSVDLVPDVVPDVVPVDFVPDVVPADFVPLDLLGASPAFVLKVPLEAVVLGFTLLPVTGLFSNAPWEYVFG
jgi:hypothetical protein